MTTPEWLDLGLRFVLAYLLGSISGSLVLGRLRGVDIRTQGSGNAGGTNAFRTQGIRFALLVVAIDIGKGILAVLLIPRLPLSLVSLGLSTGDIASWQQAVAAVGAVVGHIWPLYFGFRGGKGAATAVGAMATLSPVVLPAVAMIWIGSIILTGYVGLSTILAALTLWPSLYWLGDGVPPAYFSASLAITALVIFAHRINLQRLWQGNENRFQRARLLHRWLERRSRV